MAGIDMNFSGNTFHYAKHPLVTLLVVVGMFVLAAWVGAFVARRAKQSGHALSATELAASNSSLLGLTIVFVLTVVPVFVVPWFLVIMALNPGNSADAGPTPMVLGVLAGLATVALELFGMSKLYQRDMRRARARAESPVQIKS